MHQEHNIPWNTLASHFKYVTEDRRFTPPFTGFLLRQLPSQEKDLKYFKQRFISTIREFSVTERKKYPPARDIKPPSDGRLFSDDLLRKYPEYLDEKLQSLDYWISCSYKYSGRPYYDTCHARLVDVVKILIHENQMETLFMLASHPLVPLNDLSHLHWGHHFGFHHIAEAALHAYVFWNLISSWGYLASGAYRELKKYRALTQELTGKKDHDAQQIPHQEFYGGIHPEPPAVDAAQLHAYLKHLFALCYRYDMLVMEYSGDPRWEEEIDCSLFFIRQSVRE